MILSTPHLYLNSFLFADDTSLFFSHKNNPDVENILNDELVKVSSWLSANKLSLSGWSFFIPGTRPDEFFKSRLKFHTPIIFPKKFRTPIPTTE